MATAMRAEATVIMPNRDRARATGTGASVVGIEHIPVLTVLAQRNIRTDGLGDALDPQGVVSVTGDGRLGAYFLLFKKGESDLI